MPNLNLQVKQFQAETGEHFLVYRYKDDGNGNYEYQVYQLVEARDSARKLGVSEYKEGRASELNTREMWDILFFEESKR